jgi:FkbM family methyltransferase
MGYKNKVLSLANRFVPFCPGMKSRRPTYYQGYWLWLPACNWRSLISRYEPNVGAAIKSNLTPGSTFFDIGANVGWFTLFASKIVGPLGQVYAFEPSPDVYTRLLENVRDLKNVHTFQYGIGNKDGELEFASQGVSSSASFVEAITEINKHYSPTTPIRKIRVEIRKIDSLLPQIKRPDLIKIDVEGFELEVLKGAANLLSQLPVLIIEIHPLQLKLSNGSTVAVLHLLESFGYSCDVIDRSLESVCTIIAKASSPD